MTPLESIHDALWTDLDASADLLALVPLSSRWKLTATGNPEPRTQYSTADLPALRMVLANATAAQRRHSGGEGIDLTFALEINTGSRLLSGTTNILAVYWQTYRAALAAQKSDSAVRALEVGTPARKYVHDVKVVAAPYSPVPIEQNGEIVGIAGWQSVVSIEVMTNFSKAVLYPS